MVVSSTIDKSAIRKILTFDGHENARKNCEKPVAYEKEKSKGLLYGLKQEQREIYEGKGGRMKKKIFDLSIVEISFYMEFHVDRFERTKSYSCTTIQGRSIKRSSTRIFFPVVAMVLSKSPPMDPESILKHGQGRDINQLCLEIIVRFNICL